MSEKAKPTFKDVFASIYFHPTQLNMAEAYRIAECACKKNDMPITHSLGAIRRRLKALDPKDIALARSPEEWDIKYRYVTKKEAEAWRAERAKVQSHHENGHEQRQAAIALLTAQMQERRHHSKRERCAKASANASASPLLAARQKTTHPANCEPS